MSNWGGLNNALTAWRTAINQRFPDRSTSSDGGYADGNHSGSSQHQPDGDGTVDAFDMDVNLLRSGAPTGSDDEKRLIEALKKDFERAGRAHLWIHAREIAQHDKGWSENYYGGSSPHTEHLHWEARQDREDDGSAWPMPNTDALLEEMMALDYEETKKASGQGWAAYPVTEDATAALMQHRTYRAALLDTTDTGALRKRLDAQDAAISTVSGAVSAMSSKVDQILQALQPPT